jgi:hypothetical protein
MVAVDPELPHLTVSFLQGTCSDATSQSATSSATRRMTPPGHERTLAIGSFGEFGDQGLMADQLVEDSGSDCRATCAARQVWPRATWSPSLSCVTSVPAASTTPVPSAMGIRLSTAGCCPVTHA